MRKQIKSRGLKLISDTGEFEAVIATLNVVDKDRDVISYGAITQGQPVRIGSWGHKWDQLPVGKGKIYERGNEIIVEGKLFLDTEAGKQHYQTIKNLDELQEWSFGFNVLKSKPETRNGERVKVLQKIEVFEVSPVLVGAGFNTRTNWIKQDKDKKKPKKPWQLVELERMVEKQEKAKRERIIKNARRERVEKIMQELERMAEREEEFYNPTPKKKSILQGIAENVKRSRLQPMSDYMAYRHAKMWLHDIARDRVRNRGYDPQDTDGQRMVAKEYSLLMKWAKTPRDINERWIVKHGKIRRVK